MIHFYELATLDAAQRLRLLRRAEIEIDNLIEYIRPILQAVRTRGDDAVLEFTARFDHVQLTADQLRVRREEIEHAHQVLDPAVRQAIEQAIHNVRTFHEQQMPHEQWFTQVAPGVMVGEKVTPVTSVGLYVPRGKGAFPSVMYMLCDVHEIYRVGGAQAIAALAYGTQSIGRVRKIASPGSGFVSAAKRLLYGTVDVGLPAGPSESIILADADADPELVARDMLIEAEHGPDSSSLLVTPSRSLVEAVMALLPEKMAALPEWRQNFCRTVFEATEGTGGIILTTDMQEAVEFVNEYAPEHLEVQVREPFALLPQLHNAAEILIGPYTPICTGNYSVGTNAILPTGGFAHSYSCTSVYDFLKRTGIAYVTAEGYASISETTRRLAEFEGFPAHANAVTTRPVSLPRSSEP